MLKLIILLLSFNIFASDWQKMKPLLHCSEVTLEYKAHNDIFKVRIPHQNSLGYYIETTLRDLNDLSALTEELNKASSDYCPASEVVQNFDFGNSSCTPQQRQYTPNFIDLFRSITTIVNSDSDAICANIIPFIKLQDEISELTEADFVRPRKTKRLSGKLLKLLTDNDTDKLIDHFFACGGKRGSSSFIKNLILLNVKEACIAPKPEGALDWSDAEKIAEEISSDYESMSLMRIQKKQKEITTDAVSMFARKITTDQLKGLLSPYLTGDINAQTDQFLEGLESYQELESIKTDDLTQYVSLVYSVEAPIEIGQKVLPLIVANSFSDRLPKTWTPSEKERFTNDTLIPKAVENYKKCLASEINYSGLNQSFIGLKDKIHYRASLKNNFCQKHPEKCPENSCGTQVNFLSEDDSATDTQRVQGCVVQSITTSIKPYLEKLIEDQKEVFKKDFEMTDKMATSLKEGTWNDLTSCLNKKLESSNSILNDPSALRKIDPTAYEKYIGQCGDFAQENVSRKFVSLILLNNKTLKDSYNEGSTTIDQYGIARSNQLTAITEKILTDAYTPCMDSQQGTKDATLCTPSIEMKAASMVIEKSLKDNNSQERADLNLIIKEFKACTNTSVTSSFTDIQNSTSRYPINTAEQTKTYLDRNPAFYSCIQTAIADSSYIIAGLEFDKSIQSNLEKVKDKNYLKDQRPLVQNEIKECFSREFTQMGTQQPWTSFLAFNENDGLTKLQNKCEQEATSLVISNVVIKEAIAALDPLVENQFFNSRTEVFNILSLKANQLKEKYSVNLPSDLNPDKRTHYIFREALKTHLKEGKTVDAFLDDATANLEQRTVGVIHKNLLAKVNDQGFSSSFDKACLFGLYKITQTDQSPDSEPLSMTKLADYLKIGINLYREQGRQTYSDKMSEIKEECQNIQRFSNNQQFQKSRFYDLIIKGQIQTLFKAEFENGIMDNLKDKLKSIQNPYKDIKLVHANKMITSMQELLDKNLESKKLYSTLFSDGEVMKYAHANIDALLSSSEKVKKELSKVLINQVFNDKDFADHFVKIQVLGNFGVSAIEQTFEQATRGKKFLWGSITFGSNAGKKAAETYFSDAKNIENLIDWERIPKSNRNIMIHSVINDAVLATVDKGDYPPRMDNEFSQQTVMDKLNQSVDKITNGYRNYDENVDREALKLARLFKKPSYTLDQTVEFFKANLYKSHMDRNVEGILMGHKYNSNETIRDRITEDISSLGNDFFWGNESDERVRSPALERE